jgi:hypothetical protein
MALKRGIDAAVEAKMAEVKEAAKKSKSKAQIARSRR